MNESQSQKNDTEVNQESNLKEAVTFEETKDSIIIRWAETLDVSHYELVCRRSFMEENVTTTEQRPQCELKRSTYGWIIGETISVTITAVDKHSNCKNICSGVQFVIGGDKVPYGLQLKFNTESPHNSLILEWQPAKMTPQQYECTVYQKIDGVDKEMYTKNTKQLSVTITDLRHLTDTYCVVKCKYADGDGIPAWSKSLKTQDFPSALRDAQQINAYRDPSNPVRQITVKWQKPDKAEIDHYDVYLIYNHSQKTETQQITSTMPTIAHFTPLKSDTDYQACVLTVKRDKKTPKEAYSQVVRTDKASKAPGFNIKEEGKPYLKKCAVEKDGDDIYGIFEWSLPDLREKNNYKKEYCTATLRESGKRKAPLEIDEKQCRAEKVKLSHGKSYSFTLTCRYLEFDRECFYDASITKSITTEIGKPSIDGLDWQGKTLVLSWTPAKGANKHTFKIQRIGKPEEILSKAAKTSPIHIQSSQIEHHYGRFCSFIIEASGEGDHKKRAEEQILLGGDEAVTEVTAENDEVNPRRAILAKWQPPKQKPQGYSVILYDLNNEKKPLKDEVNPLEASQTSHRFIDLKTETNYCVRVCPIYNGQSFEGTLSNTITTKRRITTAAESNAGFGKPTNLMHATIDGTATATKIALSWSPAQMGENYRVTGYHVSASHPGKLLGMIELDWMGSTLKQDVGPNETKVKLDLKRGQRYDVKVTTKYVDLETTKSDEKSEQYEIFTDPSQTSINDCHWSNGVFHFSWQPVAGANKYQLMIRDEFFQKELLKDVVVQAKSNSKEVTVEIPTTEELRFGQTCMTRVKTYSGGDKTSESEWKAHILGGMKVPRNVTANRSSENPTRAVNLTFDKPAKGASPLYKVVIKPIESGMTRTIFCQSSSIVLEYLRKGVTYKFLVYAKLGEGIWSEGSPSNSIQTDGARGDPIVGFHGSNTVYDLRNAVLAGHVSEVNISLGRDFGKVEDLRPKLTKDRDKDIMQLQWNIPSFDNKGFDYKVENYQIEIWKGQNPGDVLKTVDFEKGRHQYESGKFGLELGEIYQVAISTLYLDIDKDLLYKSSAVTCEVPTRPGKPTCTGNDNTEDTLIIEWNDAKGAKRYQIEIYVDGSEEATFMKDMGNTTIYHKKFDESFGFGSSYYAKITAYNAAASPNSDQTVEKIIGGDRVPTNVVVASEHPRVNDPNSEVFLKWTPPLLPAKGYDISSVPNIDTMKVGSITNEECIVSGLKAGMEYSFKVKAVHNENGTDKLSGGCSSRKIRTNPTPTQVKNVSTHHGINPSTSVEIVWDKVDAEKDDEVTKYRVALWKADQTTKREEVVDNESIVLNNLESGATYYVTVAGGNSIGYGKDSGKVRFATELGTPKNVSLQINKNNPSSSLILSFSSAEGEALKYLATLYKYINMMPQELPNSIQVNSGHIFNDLEPSSIYQIKLHAAFPSGEGNAAGSNQMLTAPSKTRITKASCNTTGGKKSSREIYVTWDSDPGCHLHEINIMRGSTRTTETKLLIDDKSECLYYCLYESTDYTVQVRSKNSSNEFGEWSEEKPITLAPAKLCGVSANLDKKGYLVTIKCDAAQSHSPFYFMQPFKDKERIGEPKQAYAKNEAVEWKFDPPEHAQLYWFEVWAEDAAKNEGEKTSTNLVVSRPEKLKFKTCKYHPDNPSTDIEVEWNPQKRCNHYELKFCQHGQEVAENVVQTTANSCLYRCKAPGSMYLVSIRAVCNNTRSQWSDDEQVNLAPAMVDIIECFDGENQPVKNVKVTWIPLQVPPKGYLLKLICNGKEVGATEKSMHSTFHVFQENLKPGALYCCTVAAFKDDGDRIMGKESRSKYYRIIWNQASNFEISLDENEPSRRVIMTWDKPEGVDCYRLEIENKQSGVVTTIKVTDKRYVFHSGVPGNSYIVRLHCGCENHYDINYISQTVTTEPDPPTDLKASANNDMNGLTIEFKDTPSSRKIYQVNVQGLTDLSHKFQYLTPQQLLILRDLIPGESYKVSVCTVIGELKSKEARAEGFISTFPAEVANLCSKKENGSILFEWDELEIKPSKYIVQWRVDNKAITEEHTQKTSLKIFFLKPAHCYSARVMAANSSGTGPMSRWENFITDPLPPYKIRVYPKPEAPETSLVVKFEDERDYLKTYRIVAEGPEDKPKTIDTHEHFAIFSKLQPGRAYKFKVQTLFCGKKSTWALFSRIDD